MGVFVSVCALCVNETGCILRLFKICNLILQIYNSELTKDIKAAPFNSRRYFRVWATAAINDFVDADY